MALVVLRKPEATPAGAVTETIAAAPPPASLPTITATQPPPPPPVVVPPPAPTRKQSTPGERSFVSAVFANIPTFAIPGGRPSDVELVASGYRACEVMGQHPNRHNAAYALYEELGLNMSVMMSTGQQEMLEFMDYADTYLCNAS